MQTNTFQAALATDGVFSYILFNYRIAEMTWDYDNLASKDVIIGYNTGDGMFVNTHLENPPFNTAAMRFTPDQFNGTTGLQVLYNNLTPPDSRVWLCRSHINWCALIYKSDREGGLHTDASNQGIVGDNFLANRGS